MTQEQINDVALAARMAAIGQAKLHGDRCAFAIVVCGLDVGSGLAVQTNVKGNRPPDVVRILQNGIRALENKGGGLIILSVLALLLGIAAIGVACSGCGSVASVEASNDATTDGAAGTGGVPAAGTAGSTGGDVPAGMAGSNDAGAAGAAGTAGGAAGGGQAAGAAGMTGTGGAGAGDAGMTGAAGAGGSCAPRGSLCYQCPAPAPTCPTSGGGRFLCCGKDGAPSCDPAWCAQ
jgi:hypothetical protein